MAAYTSLLLIAALCSGTAYSLSCYTCTAASSNANCMTAANCTTGATSCMTTTTSASVAGISVYTISKACSAACTATSASTSLSSSSVTCCSNDLCNTSGASSIKSTSTILVVALGAIMVLLRGSSL